MKFKDENDWRKFLHDFKRQRLSGKNKALTTRWDFSIGIDQALSGLQQDILSKVELVSVSTTLATNAIVEGKGQKAGLLHDRKPECLGRADHPYTESPCHRPDEYLRPGDRACRS